MWVQVWESDPTAPPQLTAEVVCKISCIQYWNARRFLQKVCFHVKKQELKCGWISCMKTWILHNSSLKIKIIKEK